MASFTERMIGAAKLDVATYEEVEADTTATGQAMAIVVVYAICAGIGSGADKGVPFLIGQTIGALIGWFIWAFVIFIVGTKLLPEPQTKSDMGELLRTTGFASSPGILAVLGVIPGLGGLIMFAVWLWMLVTFVVAVRQALDYNSTGRAIAVCVIGWIVQAVFVLVIVGMLLALVLGAAAIGGAHGG